jgi:Protein of unknown function (DUF2946)
MRRRLETFIPIVMLAVLVQLLAPIGAVRAVARAVSDPLAMAQICSGLAGSHQPSSPAPAHDDCCAVCAVGHGTPVAASPPAPGFVVLNRLYQRVIWQDGIAVAYAVRTGSNAQARAPPAG